MANTADATQSPEQLKTRTQKKLLLIADRAKRFADLVKHGVPAVIANNEMKILVRNVRELGALLGLDERGKVVQESELPRTSNARKKSG